MLHTCQCANDTRRLRCVDPPTLPVRPRVGRLLRWSVLAGPTLAPWHEGVHVVRRQSRRVLVAQAITTLLMVCMAVLSTVNWVWALLILIFYPFIAVAFVLAWNPHWLSRGH